MTVGLKVLIVGGYGVFGSRVVALLEDEPRLSLFVGGRSVARANHFIRSRGKTKAQLSPIVFDRNGNVLGQLSLIGPDIVVDASGPFQSYGEDRYRIVRACLARGANYLDLRRDRRRHRTRTSQGGWGLRPFRRFKFSRADGRNCSPALGRCRDDKKHPGRHCPLALRGCRQKRHPRDRGLCGPADPP